MCSLFFQLKQIVEYKQPRPNYICDFYQSLNDFYQSLNDFDLIIAVMRSHVFAQKTQPVYPEDMINPYKG